MAHDQTTERPGCPREQASLCIWPKCDHPARCLLPNRASETTPKLRWEITIDLCEEDDPHGVYEAIESLLHERGQVGTLSMHAEIDDDELRLARRRREGLRLSRALGLSDDDVRAAAAA